MATGKSADRLAPAPPPSVNGNAFGPAAYQANPFLLSAQVRAIAGDAGVGSE